MAELRASLVEACGSPDLFNIGLTPLQRELLEALAVCVREDLPQFAQRNGQFAALIAAYVGHHLAKETRPLTGNRKRRIR